MSAQKKQELERAAELALVDHPRGLVIWEMNFCIQYALCGHTLEAFKSVCAMHELNYTDATLQKKAKALLKRPAITKYIQHLHNRLEDLGVATILEVQMFVTQVMRTAQDELFEERPLRDLDTLKLGVAAARALAELKGWNAPVKHDHTHAHGVMVVPMSQNPEEWAKAAKESQQALMDDAIDI